MRRRILDFASSVLAFVLLVATPVVLAESAGWPWAISWTAGRLGTSVGLLDLASFVAWVGWLACVHSLCRRVVVHVKCKSAVTGHNWMDGLAARIATVLLAFAPLAHSSVAAASLKVADPDCTTSLSQSPVPASWGVGDLEGANKQSSSQVLGVRRDIHPWRFRTAPQTGRIRCVRCR